MNLMLEAKTAVVTGGGSGIGRAICQLLASEGARVHILDVNGAAAESVAAELRAAGANASPYTVDVTDASQVDHAIQDVEAKHDGIDALVNCAFGADGVLFAESTRADWDRAVNVCLYGTLNCSRAVINGMIKRGTGSIVSIGSDAGRVGEARSSVYSAAKAGVIGFSKALAREVGRSNVRVNVVCPAATRTPATSAAFDAMGDRIVKAYPLRRLGEPEDIARMVVFLSSDAASWITGQTISVNGGFSMM